MATVRKRALPSGKIVWLAAYADAAGKRRFKQFGTKKEADRFLTKAKSEVAAGVHVPESQSISVGDAADLWLKSVEESGLEWSTVLHYQQHINEHIRPFIGALKLTAVTTPRIYALVDELKAAGRSPETARRAVQSLGRVYKFSKGRGLVGSNPVADVKLRSSKRGRSRPEIPSKEELRAIITATTGRWRPLIITALFTGLRASELRGLRWADIDLKRKVLTVSQRADAWKVIGAPKSAAGIRDVPLAPIVVNTLREWKLACPTSELDLVFPNGAGRIEDHPNVIARGWDPVQIAAGVTVTKKGQVKGRYNFHSLRHAAASMFIEAGMNPKKVQTVMGHSSITVTYDTYGHLFADDEADQQAMRIIEERLLR